MPNTAMFHKLGELENCDVYLEKYSRSLVCVAGEALQQLSNDCDRDVTVSDKVFEVLRTSRLNQEQLHPSPVANSPRKSGVELTLITTDSCNFACRYCFASELYQGSNTLKPDDIVRYVENFLKVCQSPVSSLILFGGEPLLAFNSIRQAWPDVKGLFRSHQEEMPSFAIVTNGSLINHEIATFFAENDFAVTVSLDGPKKVHDMCRPTRKGGSSYELVVAGIKELSRAGVYYAIEATYTSQHLELGIDVVEIIDHALSLGAQEVHVMPAFPEQASGIKEIDNDHVTSFFRDAATRSAKSYLTSGTYEMAYASRVIYAFAHNRPRRYICTAGIDKFTIMANGDVVPCYLVCDSTNKITSCRACGMNVVQENQLDNATTTYRNLAREYLPECSSCWAADWCFACYGPGYARRSELGAPGSLDCQIYKAMVESSLLECARFLISKNEEVIRH